MTASAAYAAIATLSFAFNFKFETFIEVPRLYSLIIPQNPRRNLYGPIGFCFIIIMYKFLFVNSYFYALIDFYLPKV